MRKRNFYSYKRNRSHIVAKVGALILSFAMSFSTLPVPAIKNLTTAYAEPDGVVNVNPNSLENETGEDSQNNDQLDIVDNKTEKSKSLNGENGNPPTLDAEQELSDKTGNSDDLVMEDGVPSASRATGNDDLDAVALYNDAATNRSDAIKVLTEDLDIPNDKAETVADELLDVVKNNETRLRGEPDEEPVPRQGDGSNIEYVSAKWITPDTVDNGEEDFLYYRPSGDNSFDIRLQVNYALSGEHNYEPGDITITIPENIIRSRTGNYTGNVIIPYPEDPSTKADFNWKLVNGNYVLTNTKRMSAATKGYIQIGFDSLVPYDLVDMQVSEEFDAYVEVTTHKGNTIALRSNKLTAQFDTEAKIVPDSVRKKQHGEIERVPASRIPESQRIVGEEEYILVKWYAWGAITANTYYTLDIVDSIPQDAIVCADTGLTEADAHGFIINATSENGTVLEQKNVYRGCDSGQTRYYSYETAYPASQFKPNTVYKFHNAVGMTVTEVDPPAERTNINVQAEDPKLVTDGVASAAPSWRYSLPEWKNPTGHFMVCKNGNDDKAANNSTHHSRYPGSSYSDIHIWKSRSPIDLWYGIYPSGMNELSDDNDVLLSYTIDSVGYTMPWMFDEATYIDDGELAPRKSVNYRLPVTIVTEDTGVRLDDNRKLNVFDDFEFVSLEFPQKPYVYTGTPKNINPDGSFTAMTAGDGTFEYQLDSNYAHYPDITLELYRDGNWKEYATVSWTTGSAKIELTNGSEVSGNIINMPADTENFRTKVTVQNTLDENEENIISQAAIDYDVRPVIKLRDTDVLKTLVESRFAETQTPSMQVYNGVNMKAYQNGEEEIVSIDKEGYDDLRGYTTDTTIYPTKSSRQTLKDADYVNRRVTVHYSAKIEERSVINDKKTYEQAVKDGRLTVENHGVWYDLLPQGMIPDTTSVELRKGDEVTNIRTIENYKNSGRTLLIVEADLTPVPERYRSGDMYYYEDVLRISFDAWYSFDALTDYGKRPHNVIAFESSNDIIGTTPGYAGEADDPNTGHDNNISTHLAFNDENEKTWMTNLDPTRDTPSFVYAGATTTIDIISAARLSLQKDVMVNNDGNWGTGVFGSNRTGEDGDTIYTYDEQSKAENEKVVWEGGTYSYKLRMMPDDSTQSKDMVVYDSLETFKAGDGNEPIDEMAANSNATWQGEFLSADLSQLESKGCAPVLYYSTIENLALSDETNPDIGNQANMLFKSDGTVNTDVWTAASDYTGDLSDVTAIAVDMSKKTDGTDFILEPLESVVVLVNMRAPSGENARDIIANAGAWGTSAYAYNNAYLTGTTIDINTHDEESGSFVRKDYTKVGLIEYQYKVKKIWMDDDNRDGVRPENVTVHLLENGNDTGQTLQVGADTGWEAAFEHIPYTTPEGEKIQYSIAEDDVDGYSTSIKSTETNGTIANTHLPKLISLNVSKNWVGDTEEDRPAYITIELYANGRKIQTKRIDETTNWTCEFTGLYKNENGHPIVYTAKEVFQNGDEKHLSYIPNEPDGITLSEGLDIGLEPIALPSDEGVDSSNIFTNTHHPFGDLYVSKTVTNTTAVSQEQEFEFTFEFTKIEDNETVPVFTEYDYDVLGENDEVISSGKLSTNGSIKIKGGQQIHIKEMDEYVRYSITESSETGFALENSSSTQGIIIPNKNAFASFTNKYAANGKFSPAVDKTLKNRQLRKYQFKFELYEIVDEVDETGTITGTTENLLRTATNAQPDGTVNREDGSIESSHATATFGTIRYTQEDANIQAETGKPYRYKIVEINAEKPGYTYDETVYYVDVAITDNGDGTLNIAPTYYREVIEENDIIEDLIGEDPDVVYEQVDKAEFTNEYKAFGEVVLHAWKDLQGRQLTDGEFEFELLDEDGNPIYKTDPETGEPTDEAMIARNTADGSITFEALKFDETDIGLTYNYVIREKRGSDATINYDSNAYGYSVSIYDNGDGTLSFSQTPATPIYERAQPCGFCGNKNSQFRYGASGVSVDLTQDTTAIGSFVRMLYDLNNTPYTQTNIKLVYSGPEENELAEYVKEIMHSSDDLLEGLEYFVDIKEREDGYRTYVLGYVCPECEGDGAGKCENCYGSGSDFSRMFYATLEPGQYYMYYPQSSYYPDLTYAQDYYSEVAQSMSKVYRAMIDAGAEPQYGSYWASAVQSDIDTLTRIEYSGINSDVTEAVQEYLDAYSRANPTNAFNDIVEDGGNYCIYLSGTSSAQNTLILRYSFYYIPSCPDCDGTGLKKDLVGWSTEESEIPVFKNALKNGSLSISKHVENNDSADPSQKFNFKVKLLGENVNLSSIDKYKVNQTVSSNGRSAEKTATENSKSRNNDFIGVNVNDGDVSSNLISRNNGAFHIEVQDNVNLRSSTDIDSGTFDDVDWRITSDGELIIGNGTTQTFANRTRYRNSWPWYDNENVQTVRFDGIVNGVGSMVGMFEKCKAKQIDFTGFDTTNVTNMGWMFWECEAEELILTNFVTSNVNNMANMFRDSKADVIDLSSFDTSGIVTTMTEGMQNIFRHRASFFSDTTPDMDPALAKTIILGPNFRFIGEDSCLSTPTRPEYSGKWIKEDESEGPYTPYELQYAFNNDPERLSGTWIWQIAPDEYTLYLYPGNEGTGSTISITAPSNADFQIPLNRFFAYGYDFDHWTDNYGNIYENGDIIPAHTFEKGSNQWLVATWRKYDTNIVWNENTTEISLKAGETATINNIPAGTAYQVYEETPEGWVLIEQNNVSGKIEPLITSEASFTNKYEPGTATAQFFGTKTLDGQAAEAESYSFILEETTEGASGTVKMLVNGEEQNVELPYTVTVSEGGFIQFPAIKYSIGDVGEHTYTIKEVNPNDDRVDYDAHTETIKVNVTGDVTELKAETVIDEDGDGKIAFANKTRPGELRITKNGQNVTDANKDDEFTFKVTLNNDKGLPLSDNNEIYWYKVDSSGKLVQEEANGNSHDQNKADQNNSSSTKKLPTLKTSNDKQISFDSSLSNVLNNNNIIDDSLQSNDFQNSSTTAPALKVGNTRAADDIASGVYDGVDWRVSSDYELIIGKIGETQTYSFSNSMRSFPWINKSFTSQIKSVRFEGKVIGTGDMSYMFGVSVAYGTNEMAQLSSFNADGFDTSNVTNMSYMFANARKLKELNLSGFDVSNVVNMHGIFFNCVGLEYLDVSTWDVSNATDLGYMYPAYGMKTIKIGPNFRFVENGNLPDNKQLVYQEGTGFNAKYYYSQLRWVREDGAYGPYTGEQLRNNYTADMAGTWVVEPYCYAIFDDTDNTLYFVKSNEPFDNNTVGTVTSISGGIYAGTIYGVAENGIFNNSISAADFKWRTWARRVSTVKKVVFVDSFKPTSTYYWFNGCLNCEVFDFQKLNTHAVSNMNSMLSNCNNARMFILGENFTFKPSYSVTTILPTPPLTTPYTGKWIKEDMSDGPYTPVQLRDNYIPAMAGMWIWEIDNNIGVLVYNANEGTIIGSDRTEVTSDNPVITLFGRNNVQRPHHVLTGWNTKDDGTGDHYDVASSFTVPLGKVTTLYAEWEDTNKRNCTVNYYQQKSDLSGYDQVESEVIEADIGSSVTPEVKTYRGFVSPSSQTIVIPNNDDTVVEYKYDRAVYDIVYDGNNATSGQMNYQHVVYGVSTPLLMNIYQKTGALFTGWNTKADGSGTSYIDSATVLNLADENGVTVTLYAQWMDNPNKALIPANGEIYVKCKAGETIVLPGLTAGTSYSIEEVNNLSGWKQTGTIGVDGTIIANTTNESTITNKYEANGVAEITAHKRLNGERITTSQFQFELVDSNGEVLQTVSNGEVDTYKQVLDEDGNIVENPYEGTALIKFEPLSYTQDDIGKTYIYEIREKVGSDPIVYDDTFKTVTVNVEDAGYGILATEVLYENDTEPIFVNEMQPASLEIFKTAVDEADNEVLGEEFSFKVELFDKDGCELVQEFEATEKTRQDLTAVSHTPNIDDEGNKISEFESSKAYPDIVTIPGAKDIHIELDYTSPRGYFWIWPQANEAIWTSQWTSDFNPNTCSPNISYSVDDENRIVHKSFDATGDSISLVYYCYALPPEHSAPNNGGYDPIATNYGYYMRVSGNGIAEGGKTQLRSGDTVVIESGNSLKIDGLPHGATYKVTEIPKNKWVQMSTQGTEGILQAGSVSETRFVNKYTNVRANAEGQVRLSAQKTVVGGTIKNEDGFVFELLDENGNIIQSRNVDEMGTSNSKITFDPISYTESDVATSTEYDVQVVMINPDNSTPDIITLDPSSYTQTTHGKYVDIAGTFNWEESAFGGYDRKQVIVALVSKGNTEGDDRQIVLDMSDKDSASFSFENIEKYIGGEHTYTIREQKGIDHNMIYDSTQYEAIVLVTDSGQGYLETNVEYRKGDDTVGEAEFRNERLADIKVVKRDSLTERALPGAKFTIKQGQLYLQSDGTLSESECEFTTDVNGMISANRIHAGQYTLHETNAPSGYVPSDEDITFTIDDGSIIVENKVVDEITVYNAPSLDLPNSGVMPWTLLMIFADIAVITGVAYYIRLTRKKSQQKTNMPKS